MTLPKRPDASEVLHVADSHDGLVGAVVVGGCTRSAMSSRRVLATSPALRCTEHLTLMQLRAYCDEHGLHVARTDELRVRCGCRNCQDATHHVRQAAGFGETRRV